MVDKKDEAVDQSAVTQLGAALERLVAEDKVDEKVLAEINSLTEGLNDKTKAALFDLPVIQRIVESQSAKGGAEPGTVISQGMFSRKVPYSRKDLYAKWGTVESFTSPETITVVTPGGWQFRLREGITYDQPVGTAPTDIPEDHGYQLPKIVVSILEERRRTLLQNKRTLEEKPFGQGVKFLQTGWGGKAQEVAVADAASHPDPTTE